MQNDSFYLETSFDDDGHADEIAMLKKELKAETHKTGDWERILIRLNTKNKFF